MKDSAFIRHYGIELNQPMAPLTAVGVGGNADFYVKVSQPATLQEILGVAAENDLKVMMLGRGTNTVFSDYGWRGLVIQNEIRHLKLGSDQVTAGSGWALPEVIHRLAEQGLGGFEDLAAVPGTVGGAVWGNTGSGDVQLSDVLLSVKAISNRSLIELGPEDLQWGQRDSRFKHRPEYVVEATLRTEQKDKKPIDRAILAAGQRRLKTQPPGKRCIGLFRDPLPREAGELAAAVGLAGERIGGAVVSKKNPNFIINDGKASAQDIYRLAQRIKERVKAKMGIKLREQVAWAGEW